MKKRILIYVSARTRDAASHQVLGLILARRGYNVAYASPATAGFMLRTWRPHMVFLTNPDTIDGFGPKGLGLVGGDNGPVIVMFPQEGMNFAEKDIETWYGRFRDPELAKSVGRIFFWNAIEYDWVSKNTLLRPDQLAISGGLRLDLVRENTVTSDGGAAPSIGFICRFAHFNRFDRQTVIQKLLGTGHPPDDKALTEVSLRLDGELRTLACYAHIVERIMTETDYVASLRIHHTESPGSPIYRDLKRLYGNRIEIDASQSIYHWAARQKAIVSTVSTTMAEIYLARTPMINVDRLSGAGAVVSEAPFAETNEPEMLECFDGETSAISYDAVMHSIRTVVTENRKLPRNEKTEAFLKKGYSWPFRRSPIAIIVDSIDDLMAEGRVANAAPALPLLPKTAGNLYYFLSLARRTQTRRWSTTSNYFNPLLHRMPEYVPAIAGQIEDSLRETATPETALADNRI